MGTSLHRRPNPGPDRWLLNGQSSSAGPDPGSDANRYPRRKEEPRRLGRGSRVVAKRFDQEGMATTFVGAVTWFEVSLMLVMSNE
jgi:hypothetical protein